MIVVFGMRTDARTKAYVARRSAEDLGKRESMRCLNATWPERSIAFFSQALDIHESVRGGHYHSLPFGRSLHESGILPSMGLPGDAYDNSAAESFIAFIASIKTELLKRRSFKTRDEARLAVFRYIEVFYNPQRRHSALGYRSPLEYEKMITEKELTPEPV